MGELKPVTRSSYGVVNMVSVLVSVADPKPQLSLLHTQLELEARVGIERGSFTVPNLTHSVTRPILALFHAGASNIFHRSTTTFHCSVIARVLLVW